MTKEQTISRLLSCCFPYSLPDPPVADVKAALEEAYEAGMAAQVPHAAPIQPRSALIYVEETRDTLEVSPVVDGFIKVRHATPHPEQISFIHIPVQYKDDLDWLYLRCCNWRLATFRKLGEHLVKM